jgi:peptidyl-prolyl cis-trans isomerase D
MKWLMWLIILLVTISFLFFGIYPAEVGGSSVANVDGTVISSDEFNRAYQNVHETYRQVLKDQFTEAFAKELKMQVLRDLITERLLIQEAGRIGLKVTKEELQAAIMKEPAFSRDGKFDKKTYERLLDRVNMKPARYEASQRDYLLRQKVEQLVRDGVTVTDEEVAEAYKLRNQKAKSGDLASFRQSYLAGKQRDVLSAYIKAIYDRTPIKINDKLLAS